MKSQVRLFQDILGKDFIRFENYDDCSVFWIRGHVLLKTMTILRDHPDCYFKQLIDLTAVDYINRSPRFDVVYHLLSLHFNKRIRIKFSNDEKKHITSIECIYPNANWYEREIWDMFGLSFSDHPDLRRILTDYNFSGHPLQKDFPLTGYTQVRFDKSLQKVVQEPVELSQEYRNFNFLSPWEGGLNSFLPGDEKSIPSEKSRELEDE